MLSFAYFNSYMDRSIIGLLVEPIKADLSLTDTQIGFVTGLSFAVFYAIAGIPLGRLADSRNRRYIITVVMLFWSAMTMACGLAKSFITLFLARVGVGIGETGLNPAALSMISDYFPPKKRHFATSTFNVGGSLGGGMAFILGAVILAFAEASLVAITLPYVGQLAAWQWTFIIVGAPGILLALVFYFTVREPVRQGVGDAGAETLPLKQVLAYYRENARAFTGVLLAPGILFMINMSYLLWSPAYFVRIHDMDLTVAGAAFGSAVLVSGVLGNYICAALVKWYDSRGLLDGPIRAMRAVALLATIPVCIGALLPNPYLSIAVLAPALGLMIGMGAVAFIAIQSVTPNRLRGQTVAAYSLSTNLIGAALGPVIIGVMTDFVFRSENMIHYSLATLSVVVMPIVIAMLFWATPGYRRTAEDAAAQGVMQT